jgi:truncated hemoglobin YjbI
VSPGTQVGTLYDRLGGRAGIDAVADRFCGLALRDPLLRPYLADADRPALRRRFTAILQAAGAGTAQPAEGLGGSFDDEAFDRLTYYLSVALHEHQATARDIDEVLLAVRRGRRPA